MQSAAPLLTLEWRGQQAFQAHLLKNSTAAEISGHCVPCGLESEFAYPVIGEEIPNWRENLQCALCGLINRWRASLHLASLLEAQRIAGPVYVTEQTTPLFDWLQARIPELIGSEYVAPDAQGGRVYPIHDREIRHEDVTALSMANASLAMIQSYDVLEHVPDYRAALREFSRVLAPGGLLLLTAPFVFDARQTVVRARVGANKEIEHLLPAMYHGDPMSSEGVLCYQDFGWDLLDDLRTVGFSHAEVITCWAPEFGYLGSAQPFIIALR